MQDDPPAPRPPLCGTPLRFNGPGQGSGGIGASGHGGRSLGLAMPSPQRRQWTTPRGHSIPAAMRRHILERDGGICYVCGQPGADQVDHVINVRAGGSDDPTNLRAIHARPCHMAKTQREAAAARSPATQRRQPETHPGLTGPPPPVRRRPPPRRPNW